MARLIAVCTSPALDRNYVLDRLALGTLNRAANPTVTAGGKGVNVARVLALLGERPVLLGFAAGETGRFLRRELRRIGVQTHMTVVPGTTRYTLNLLDRSTGEETEITETGPSVGAEALHQFLFHFEDTVAPGDLVVLAGGLPVGAPVDLYARMVRTVHEKGARCILDTGAEPLRAALPERPDLVKPNLRELSALVGRPVRQKAEAIEAVRSLGIERAVVSLGAQGALLVDAGGAWFSQALPVEVASTIGSGDSLVAGMALGMHRRMPWKRTLALAMACAASNASRVEVGVVDPDEVFRWATTARVRKVPVRGPKR